MPIHQLSKRVLAWLSCWLLACVAAAQPAAFDYWYLLTIDGKPSGYARTQLQVHDEQIVTTYDQHVVEAHDGERLTYTTRVQWVETLAYEPIRYRVVESDGAEAVTQTYRFTDDGVERVSEQGGRRTTTVVPEPAGEWLTPAGFEVALREALLAGRDEIELRTWDPDFGQEPYTVLYARPEPAKRVGLDAVELELTRWVVEYSYLPGLTTYEYFDAEHRQMGYQMDIGGGQLAESHLADASVVALEFDPPEMAQRSVVVPDRRIENLGEVELITYELSFGGAGRVDHLPPTLPHQAVERLGDRRARVTIDLRQAIAIDDADRPTDTHLVATIAVDHNDPEIRKLADRAARVADPAEDPLGYARACERLVTRHINRASLSVGNATASEAARTRTGDCTECSVLLAAMLRAKGIPSRGVSGLVYSAQAFVGFEHAFVYHQWTQAWITNPQGNDGQWVDLDSAMLGYSAGHIALGLMTFGDEDTAAMLRLVPMTMDLGIEIKEVER